MNNHFNIEKMVLVVPACVRMGKKNYYLNLNAYSNWHHIVRNNVKKRFTLLAGDEIKRLPKMSKIHSLTYTLIRTTNRSRDRMNVYSIVDKFFCDALQEYKRIDDDSDDYINKFEFTKTEYIKGSQNDIRVEIKVIFEKD